MIKPLDPDVKRPRDRYVSNVLNKHVNFIGLSLRRIDRDELWAAGDFSAPRDILNKCVKLSLECYTGLNPDSVDQGWGIRYPACLFGVGCDYETAYGVRFAPVWFMAVEGWDIYWRAFAKHSHAWIDYFYKKYGPIGNHVWSQNRASITWLRRHGFQPIGQRMTRANQTFITLVKP